MDGRPINEKRRELEDSLGVNARQVQRIIKEMGLDRIEDMVALRLVEKRVLISLRSLQMRREEHLMDLAKKDVLPTHEVRALGRRIGELVQWAFNDFVQRGPAELAGHSELQIYDWLRRNAADCINSLLAEVGKLDNNDQG